MTDYSKFVKMIMDVNGKLASGLEAFSEEKRVQTFTLESLETQYISPPEEISKHRDTLQESLPEGLEINSLKIIPITGKEYSKVRLCLSEEATKKKNFIVVEFYVGEDKLAPGYLLTRKEGHRYVRQGGKDMRRQCLIADFGNVTEETPTVYVEQFYIRDMTDPANNASSLDCDTDYIDENPTGKDPIYDLAFANRPGATRKSAEPVYSPAEVIKLSQVRQSVRMFNPMLEKKNSALAEIVIKYSKIKDLIEPLISSKELKTVHSEIIKFLDFVSQKSGHQNREHTLAFLLGEAKDLLKKRGDIRIVDAYMTLLRPEHNFFSDIAVPEAHAAQAGKAEEAFNQRASGGGSRVSKKRRKAKRGGARSNKKRKSAVKSRKRGLSKNKRAKRSRKALRRK